MKHVDPLETTELPDRLAREFTAGATCVAVMVEASGGESVEPPADLGGEVRGAPSRRTSVTVFRVGEGYVAVGDGAGGATETVGMGPGQFEEYVERVRQDDGWTVLSGTGGTGARREQLEGGSTLGR